MATVVGWVGGVVDYKIVARCMKKGVGQISHLVLQSLLNGMSKAVHLISPTGENYR